MTPPPGTSSRRSAPSRPTLTPSSSQRDLTPDVSRGLALLGIAVVNAALLAPGPVVSTADRVTGVLVTVLLENRSWPMFALLFGAGIATIGERLDARGLDARARDRVLRRRNAWLVAFGIAQVVLVFWGDILGVYGLTGMAVVAVARRSARTLAGLAAASAGLWALGTVALAWGGSTDEVPTSATWAGSIGERLEIFVFWTTANTVLLTHLAPMLLGVALVRCGVLRRPTEHRRLLRRLASGGIAIGLVGAIPLCLVVVGAVDVSDPVRALALGLHALTGLAQGTGYVALVALWAARRAPGTVPRGAAFVLAATGQRSLSAYLLHSVLLGLTLSPWSLDLGSQLSAAATYGLGLLVWVACAVTMLALAAVGRAGPFDALLRRLTYGREALPAIRDAR